MFDVKLAFMKTKPIDALLGAASHIDAVDLLSFYKLSYDKQLEAAKPKHGLDRKLVKAADQSMRSPTTPVPVNVPSAVPPGGQVGAPAAQPPPNSSMSKPVGSTGGPPQVQISDTHRQMAADNMSQGMSAVQSQQQQK